MSKQRAAALIDAGVFLQLAGDLNGARDLFKQALALDPDNVKGQHLYTAVGGQLPARAPAPPPAPAPSSPLKVRVAQPVERDDASHHTIPGGVAAVPVSVEVDLDTTIPPRSRTPARSTPPSPSPFRTFLPKSQPVGDSERDLAEIDVFMRYGMYDKALDYVMRVLRRDSEHLAAHEKAYAVLHAAGHRVAALEQLLNVLRLMVVKGESERARPYLEALRQLRPGHPELERFQSLLGDATQTLPPSRENPVPVRVGDATVLESAPRPSRPRPTPVRAGDLTLPPKKRR